MLVLHILNNNQSSDLISDYFSLYAFTPYHMHDNN